VPIGIVGVAAKVGRPRTSRQTWSRLTQDVHLPFGS
jgi:hypothetical protein